MSMDRNPFKSLEEQFDQMRRQFETILERWDGEELGLAGSGGPSSSMGIDLADREDEFVMTADVPGFDRDDIDVRLTDDTIHITAEREHTEREGDEEHYLRSEREHRTIRRAVRLPASVEADAVEAAYRNGVLTITLPKTDPGELDGQKIDIQPRD